MRLRLTENIKEIINIERGEFVSNLKFHLSDKFQLFPDQILTGKIMNNKLKARTEKPVTQPYLYIFHTCKRLL